ncbi:MAG: hypothetical protein KJ069_26865 [Anaerolineae bacterium]|nr:hypothetical protein [Anaerolineae bacterium]
MSFDWRTEETVHWDEPPTVDPEPEPPPKRRRWRWAALFLLLLLVGGAVGAFWWLQSRVETATTAVTGDVLASHELIAAAAVDGDAELVATFLSGRDRGWSEAIEMAVLAGDYQDRTAFGLTWLPADPATAVISATLNPEFNEAEVIAEHVYAYAIGNGLTDTVRLRQTAVYRSGPNRWLLAPPDANFWGETRTKQGFYLTLQYPARDEALAQRLALDMDTALAAMCASTTFHCPEDFQIQVELSTDPNSLLPENSTATFVNDRWRLRLPTPTLMGLPQDEVGYQVLARAYAAQLVVVVMRLLSGTATGTQGPFLDAWFTWQLDRFALRPYSLAATDRQALAEQSVSLRMGEQLWFTGEPATPFAYALIEFLIQDLRVKQVTIMDTLIVSEARLYEEWLVTVTDGRYTLEELETRWQQYLQKP